MVFGDRPFREVMNLKWGYKGGALIREEERALPGGLVVKTPHTLPRQRLWVPFLVGELRSPKPGGMAKKKRRGRLMQKVHTHTRQDHVRVQGDSRLQAKEHGLRKKRNWSSLWSWTSRLQNHKKKKKGNFCCLRHPVIFCESSVTWLLQMSQ